MTKKQKLLISNMTVLVTFITALSLLVFNINDTSFTMTQIDYFETLKYIILPMIGVISLLSTFNVLIGYSIVYPTVFISFKHNVFHTLPNKVNHKKIDTITQNNPQTLCVFRC